jgi:VIT1/CCC1 family predicted Fe2+/Mn2+ transporter
VATSQPGAASERKYVKGRFTGARPIRSAIQTALIGGLAAAVAFGLAKAIS